MRGWTFLNLKTAQSNLESKISIAFKDNKPADGANVLAVHIFVSYSVTCCRIERRLFPVWPLAKRGLHMADGLYNIEIPVCNTRRFRVGVSGSPFGCRRKRIYL